MTDDHINVYVMKTAADYLKEQFDTENTAKRPEYDEAAGLESKKQRG